jgi:Domain of unknown function (DUF4190)/GYF domain 2
MNYTIVGNDGKTYGPVDAAQLRIWLKQSRVDNRTPVFVAGTTDWTFLGLLPEFAADFAGSPPVISATRPATVSPVATSARTNGLALWGFICSLLAWTICCCFPLSLLGLVFSIIGLTQVNASNGTQEGRGLAIAGICISAAHLLWSCGFMLLGLLDQPPEVMWNFPH